MTRRIYAHIASLLAAALNADKAGNHEWATKHRENAEALAEGELPSGSGFDSGTKLDVRSTPNRIVLSADYHHMNEGGYYDGWTEHEVIVTPDLADGFNLRVTGRDRNDIKDYIAETFHYALSREATWVKDDTAPNGFRWEVKEMP